MSLPRWWSSHHWKQLTNYPHPTQNLHRRAQQPPQFPASILKSVLNAKRQDGGRTPAMAVSGVATFPRWRPARTTPPPLSKGASLSASLFSIICNNETNMIMYVRVFQCSLAIAEIPFNARLEPVSCHRENKNQHPRVRCCCCCCCRCCCWIQIDRVRVVICDARFKIQAVHIVHVTENLLYYRR